MRGMSHSDNPALSADCRDSRMIMIIIRHWPSYHSVMTPCLTALASSQLRTLKQSTMSCDVDGAICVCHVLACLERAFFRGRICLGAQAEVRSGSWHKTSGSDGELEAFVSRIDTKARCWTCYLVIVVFIINQWRPRIASDRIYSPTRCTHLTILLRFNALIYIQMNYNANPTSNNELTLLHIQHLCTY